MADNLLFVKTDWPTGPLCVFVHLEHRLESVECVFSVCLAPLQVNHRSNTLVAGAIFQSDSPLTLISSIVSFHPYQNGSFQDHQFINEKENDLLCFV